MLMKMTMPRVGVVSIAVLTSLALAACGGGAAPKSADHGPAPEFDAKLAAQGKTVANANGCIACHTVDGKTGVGPTWKGLYGHDVTMLDGSTVKADDAYLRESIVNPGAKVVKGYTAGVMPATFGNLNDGDLKSLVEYMKSLH